MEKTLDKEKINKILKNERFIIINLFLFSFILRLVFKNAGLFHFDSYADARTVEQILETGKMQYSYAYGSPTAMVVVFIFFFIDHLIRGTNQAEAAYFFVTFLTASLSVVLLYLITKKVLKSRYIAVATALFFSVVPVFLAVTTYPKTHSISIFFALLGGYWLLKSRDENSLKYLILSGLSFGFNIGTRPDGVLYIIPFALLYFYPQFKNKSLILNRKRFNLKNILIFSASVAIVPILLFLPWWLDRGISNFLASINPQVETRGGYLGIISSETIPSFLKVKTAMTWFGIILAVIGGVYLYLKKRKYELLFLLVWFSIFFFTIGNLARVHARFLLPAIIPLTILAASGCHFIRRKNKLVALGVTAVLMISMFAVAYPIIGYRHEHSGTRDFATYVASVTEPNAVIMTNDLGFFMQYYENRKITFHPRTGDDKEIQDFMNELRNYTNDNIPIYATEEGFAIDPGQKVLSAITDKYDIILIGESDNEWYGGSSLELKVYKEKLFKLVPKP